VLRTSRFCGTKLVAPGVKLSSFDFNRSELVGCKYLRTITSFLKSVHVLLSLSCSPGGFTMRKFCSKVANVRATMRLTAGCSKRCGTKNTVFGWVALCTGMAAGFAFLIGLFVGLGY